MIRTLRFFLLFLAVLSALGAVAARRQEIRLLRQVQEEEKQVLHLQQEYRELLLDRSRLSDYARIEQIASTRLGMVVPVINLPTSRSAHPAPVIPPVTPNPTPAPADNTSVITASSGRNAGGMAEGRL
ncbi:MAG: cell division protein FtsL [Zoogloeaceae bacterium]|nr:cell division protein FtsL [Zoogloeaceae bacterium]